MLGNCFINLRISGLGLDLNEITNTLRTIPNNAYKKGDKKLCKITLEEFEHTEDYWIASVEFDKQQPLENEIEKIILKYLPYAKYLRGLSERSEITFWVSLYPETEQFNVHLTKKSLTALSEMGVTFDCSVAYLQAFYDGTMGQIVPKNNKIQGR